MLITYSKLSLLDCNGFGETWTSIRHWLEGVFNAYSTENV